MDRDFDKRDADDVLPLIHALTHFRPPGASSGLTVSSGVKVSKEWLELEGKAVI